MFRIGKKRNITCLILTQNVIIVQMIVLFGRKKITVQNLYSNRISIQKSLNGKIAVYSLI